MKVTNPADIVRYTLAHYKKVQTVWTDNLYLKTDYSQAENICPDSEFIVMFEKRGKPAAINVSIDGKSKDKQTIFANKQAPLLKKPFLPKK